MKFDIALHYQLLRFGFHLTSGKLDRCGLPIVPFLFSFWSSSPSMMTYMALCFRLLSGLLMKISCKLGRKDLRIQTRSSRGLAVQLSVYECADILF